MSIALSDYEAGRKYAGDYAADLAAVQRRLARIQVAHIVHGRRSVVLLEGWDAAGKGGIIQRATATLDPRYYAVFPIGAPTAEEMARHYLWRFWQRMPAQGSLAFFDRSWYGRVLVERVEGYCTPAQWQSAYDEINAFEDQHVASGTAIVKLFVHVTQKTQDRQLAQRLDDPWKRWKTGAEDYRNRSRRAAYEEAMHEMFERTHRPQAPWLVIDGNNRKAARIAALSGMAQALAAQVPMTMPEADPAVVALAREAFGYRPGRSAGRD